MTEPAPNTAVSRSFTGVEESAGSPGIEALLGCIGHPLFWMADYLDDTPALSALPLIFWLTDALAPTTAQSQGPGSGAAHLALCQAGARLGLDLRVSHAGDAGEGFTHARVRYGPIPDKSAGEPVDILAVGLPETGASSLKDLVGQVSQDGALILFGPGLTDTLIGDVPATDMQPLTFGASAPQVVVLLGPGAPAPLSELTTLPPDSPERQAISQFVTRMGRMHRMELAARGPGVVAPQAGIQDVAPPPSRHAEDIERLLAKMIEMEEDRLALSRNRPAPTSSPTDATPDASTALQGRLHDLEAEIALLQQRVREGERDLKAIRASTSWRVTAPLRSVIRALRRLSRR